MAVPSDNSLEPKSYKTQWLPRTLRPVIWFLVVGFSKQPLFRIGLTASCLLSEQTPSILPPLCRSVPSFSDLVARLQQQL